MTRYRGKAGELERHAAEMRERNAESIKRRQAAIKAAQRRNLDAAERLIGKGAE